MKKIIIPIIIIILILIAGISIWLYKEEQENIKLDRESVTLKENLEVEFGKKAKVSDFIENLNGSLVNDYEIDTEKLGDIEVSFDYINIKNKKRPSKFSIKVIDVNAPQIFSGNSYNVTEGYNKNLTDVLLSADDIDDNPKREIVGEYDTNIPGRYNLIYVVTDSSGNKTEKPFVLNVNEKTDTTTPPPAEEEKLDIADVIRDYKTKKTKIGIDVSKWQQDINWEEVKNAGVEFVIIRMGYQKDYDGEYVIDPYFEKNIQGAKSVDLPVGAYFYSYAKSVTQAKEQAEWVRENLKDYELDLPVAFDWESWSSFNTARNEPLYNK